MTKSLLHELRSRNQPLYWFGLYNLAGGILCILLMLFDSQQLLGISRWLKPMKFFLSVWIMVWTMGWLLYYLDSKRNIRIIAWLIVITMFLENVIIFIQSIRSQPSHFNIKSPFDGMLFGIMGIAILVFTFCIIYAAWLFFRQKEFFLAASYLWGIRLGLIFFIIFSIEGGVMLSNMSHTVGGPDGAVGLPLVNWSSRFGDLRIAHFFGMHSLQLLPLAGCYAFKKQNQLFIFSAAYFLFISALFVMALSGRPIIYR